MANVLSKEILRRGNGRNGANTYQMISDAEPSRQDIVDTQIALGFHPAGYGGPDTVNTRPGPEDGQFSTTWTSASTCD